jgi:hypothetical protein
MQDQYQLFQVASLVNHSHKLESGKAQMMNATYGERCFEQFKRLNPSMSSRRMSMVSRILMADWFSSKCALTWKMKGTKFNRILFQLVPKMLPIAETDVGLLPTPSAMIVGDVDMKKLDERREKAKKNCKNGNGFGKSLPELMKKGMLPTPQSRDWKGAQGQSYKGEAHDLPGVMMGMLPNPSAGNEKSNGSLQEWGGSENKMRGTTLGSSRLSTRFVGEMMGFPKGWTESPFLSGETKA